MVKRYYVHCISKQEYTDGVEYIYDTDNIDLFVREVFECIQNSYYKIEGSEELNMIDNSNWAEFFSSNNIFVHEDDWFPYELVIKALKQKIDYILLSDVPENIKFDILLSVVNYYSQIVSGNTFNGMECYFEISIFNNNLDFAKFLFNYLERIAEYNDCLSFLLERIIQIKKNIERNNFPKTEFHEGILCEWICIFNLINYN